MSLIELPPEIMFMIIDRLGHRWSVLRGTCRWIRDFYSDFTSFDRIILEKWTELNKEYTDLKKKLAAQRLRYESDNKRYYAPKPAVVYVKEKPASTITRKNVKSRF